MKKLFQILLMLFVSPALLLALETSAVKSLSVRINKYSDLAQLHLQRAKLYRADKQLQKASFDLSRAVVINPNLEEAQFALAEVLLEEGKRDEALKQLEGFIKLSKQKRLLLKSYELLGDIYMIEKRYQEALKQYQEVFKIAAVNKQVYYIKASEAYYELGNFRQSIRVLKEGLSSMIDKELLREKMVDISVNEGHYTLALSVLDEMLKTNGNNAQLYYKRAKVLKEQGKIKEMKKAIKNANLALMKKPINTKQSAEIQKQLKQLYAGL